MLLALPGPAAGAPGDTVLVFNGENNRLNAYAPPPGEADEFPKQTVIPSALDDPDNGRDINAQICFDPSNPRNFIAGEDTGQDEGASEEGGQGWGYFTLSGDRIGDFGWEQIGKLETTYSHMAPETTPENYGCGFLSNGTLVTSDVGDQFPGEPATGQLILWFPPFDSSGDIAFCKIDTAIPTAGGIHVDDQDRVYVTANRDAGIPTPPPIGKRAGVYRYSGDWPTGPDAAGGCGQTDDTGAPLVDDGRIEAERFIPGGPTDDLLTPSAIVGSPSGGFYVSSVFDGKIAEFDADGAYVRTILEPPGDETAQLPYSTGTPFGLGIDSNGTLYYADIGVGLGPPPGPEQDEGSVFRIGFDAGEPLAPEMMDDGLQFPDGIGVLELAAQPGPTETPTTSASPSATPSTTAAPTPTPTSSVAATGGTTGATSGGATPETGGGVAALGVTALATAAIAARRRSRS